jgi:hypothetical protein
MSERSCGSFTVDMAGVTGSDSEPRIIDAGDHATGSTIAF